MNFKDRLEQIEKLAKYIRIEAGKAGKAEIAEATQGILFLAHEDEQQVEQMRATVESMIDRLIR